MSLEDPFVFPTMLVTTDAPPGLPPLPFVAPTPSDQGVMIFYGLFPEGSFLEGEGEGVVLFTWPRD